MLMVDVDSILSSLPGTKERCVRPIIVTSGHGRGFNNCRDAEMMITYQLDCQRKENLGV